MEILFFLLVGAIVGLVFAMMQSTRAFATRTKVNDSRWKEILTRDRR